MMGRREEITIIPEDDCEIYEDYGGNVRDEDISVFRRQSREEVVVQ
ncbi:hypothetical protein Metev_0654 [Methanohalobium evestigatum Z-7303]|uniref:Uncharacterized protein n=1 Tax=Methanohalobium evestigatum (strain ATCC BAA-1072 / DSM 3721 / NBRC 107634 / OCM 161 / Z-7303) TaxID=644295 RepID=D7E6T6_METEZ|nr:hypothetical protein [Methanohalobium evestigatum]ADI73560.1 hypothetical protein Metev_0654 [Methanohalobium evestigatum Z-7303]